MFVTMCDNIVVIIIIVIFMVFLVAVSTMLRMLRVMRKGIAILSGRIRAIFATNN